LSFTDKPTKVLSLRLEPALQARLEVFAKETHGTLSDAARLCLQRGLDQADTLGRLDALSDQVNRAQDVGEITFQLAYILAELAFEASPKARERLGELKQKAAATLRDSTARRVAERGGNDN
jgi:hypothetical protein